MNPFILTPARKKDFINREEIMSQIIWTVVGKSLGDVWVEGARQVGKTSLLQHIEYKGDDIVCKFKHYHTNEVMKPAFMYFNVQAIETVDEFFKVATDTVRSRFDLKDKQETNLYDNFVNHIKVIFKQGIYPVLLIDEFDSMLENFDSKSLLMFIKKFNSTLEHIPSLDNKPKAFSCIFAANSSFSEILYRKEVDLKSQSGLKFEAFELEWFSKAHVAELAKRYLQNNKITFTDKEIDLCYKYTQGYPYFTQKMFRIMYQAKPRFNDFREFEKFIKNQIGKEIINTIEAWGREKMPTKTISKIQQLLDSKPVQKLTDLSVKALEILLKSQFAK